MLTFLEEMELGSLNVTIANKNYKKVKPCLCLPACFEIRYSMLISHSPLTDVMEVPTEYLNKKNKTYFK
jgi:hypothetical protein